MQLYKAVACSYDAHWNSSNEYIGIFSGNEVNIKTYLHNQGFTAVELTPVVVQHVDFNLNVSETGE